MIKHCQTNSPQSKNGHKFISRYDLGSNEFSKLIMSISYKVSSTMQIMPCEQHERMATYIPRPRCQHKSYPKHILELPAGDPKTTLTYIVTSQYNLVYHE